MDKNQKIKDFVLSQLGWELDKYLKSTSDYPVKDFLLETIENIADELIDLLEDTP